MLEFSPTDYQTMALSAKVAITATVVSLPFGYAAACLLVISRMRGKAVLEGLSTCSWWCLRSLSVSAAAFSWRTWLGRSPAPQLDIRAIFTWWAAVIASLVVCFRLLVSSIRIGMEEIDERLLQASRTHGAPWYDTLTTVVLPLSGRSIMAEATLMFARSLIPPAVLSSKQPF